MRKIVLWCAAGIALLVVVTLVGVWRLPPLPSAEAKSPDDYSTDWIKRTMPDGRKVDCIVARVPRKDGNVIPAGIDCNWEGAHE